MGNHNNMKNATLAIVAPLPSMIFYLCFLHNYTNPNNYLSSLWSWCYHHPILLTNVLFFLNINVLFWVIAQLQFSHWMIDPHWPAVPVMLVYYYATHPCASCHTWRSKLVIILTSLWSLRLSHNYFRCENWQWGVKEDWRFTDMRHQYGHHWWWVSFFTIYFAQQHQECRAEGIREVRDTNFADTQLHDFSIKNVELKASGKSVIPILEKGMWRYSRHPNYFGEQLWWWGLGIFAWSLGQGWAFIGAFVNTLCLAYVTTLVEGRMLTQSFRAEAYRGYQKTTSVWIPWFKSSSFEETKDKNS